MSSSSSSDFDARPIKIIIKKKKKIVIKGEIESKKESRYCNVEDCKEKKHGKFDECRQHFMDRHREGNKFKWVPQEVAYNTFMTILGEYPHIYNTKNVKIKHITDKSESSVPLICSICNFQWNPVIRDIINHGSGCPQCSKNAKYDLKLFTERMSDRPEIDISNVREKDIKNCTSCVPVSCKTCFHEWFPSINGLIVSKNGCPLCAGKAPYNLELFQKKMLPKVKIDISKVTKEHILGANSRVPVSCRDCFYEWLPTINNVVNGLSGCAKCAGQLPYTLELFKERMVTKTTLDISGVKKEHIKGSESKIPIRCNICDYQWNPQIKIIADRKNNHGCPNCAGNAPWTLERFVKAMEKREEIDISRVEEKHINNYNSHVPVECKKCGYGWNPTISSLATQKTGCPSCACRSSWTLDRFRESMKERSNIDISEVKEEHIKGSASKVPLICKECGYHWKTRINCLIIYHTGCPDCAGNSPWTLTKFVKKMRDRKEINISGVRQEHIKNPRSRVPVSCNKCGHMWETAISNLVTSKKGCSRCKSSKGVAFLVKYFKELEIFIETEKAFDGLVYIDKLRIDIYIPEMKGIKYPFCIEFDGDFPGSHFKYRDDIEKARHISTVKRDKIKDNYARDNKMHMIRIPYTCFPKNSEEKLKETLEEALEILKTKKKPYLCLMDEDLYRKRDENLPEE